MTKPIIYAPIPDFDQETQAVFQTEPVDRGEYIEIGVEVQDLPPQEGGEYIGRNVIYGFASIYWS